MGKYLWTVAAIVTLLTANALPQATRTPGHAITRMPPRKASLLPANYEISAVVLKGQGIFMVDILPAPEFRGTSENAFQAFLADHFAASSRANAQARHKPPKVLTRFG